MLTPENFRSAINNIPEKRLREELGTRSNQYFSMYVTGNFGDIIFEGHEQYDGELDEEMSDSGGLYCDGDTLEILYREAVGEPCELFEELI